MKRVFNYKLQIGNYKFFLLWIACGLRFARGQGSGHEAAGYDGFAGYFAVHVGFAFETGGGHAPGFDYDFDS
jgi:hypothetical protein